MGTILIDNERLAVTLPDGFDRIEHGELKKLMNIAYDNIWGVRDTGRHMLLTASWKDSNKLLAKLVSEKAVAKRVDKTFAQCYRKVDVSNYKCGGYFECDVAGADAKAQGFRFSYVVEGVGQDGEVLVFKQGIRCYTMCYYVRPSVAADNRPVYEAILASLEVR